ncbi:MAG: hypothetical protein O7C67_11995 [Gammaproteobacteria bacterium]|nr:hypothetical protein [Gammaproteobacteria bacterium]
MRQRCASPCRLIVLITPWLFAAGCGSGSETRICVGTDEFCDEFFTSNVNPHARAGPDLEVTSGDRVELDGSGSADDDGTISDFSWVQLSGEPVAIIDGTKSVASFEAPVVDAPNDLVFRLTVTDNEDASDDDSVRVTVNPPPTAAAKNGIALLKRTILPLPLIPAPGSEPVNVSPSVNQTFVGLWMLARIEAFERGLDVELTRLLDELRVVMHFEHSLAVDVGQPTGLALYVESLRRLRAFTDQYDPAVADLANQRLERLGIPSKTTLPGIWLALDETGSHILMFGESPNESRARAINTLLNRTVSDPIAIANSTLIILAGL